MTDLSNPVDPQYGTLAPSSFEKNVIDFTRSLPTSWIGKRLGFGLRKLIDKDPIDIDVFGLKLRLHPNDNKCEKRVLCLPQLFDPEERQILKEFALSMDIDRFSFVDLGSNVGLYSLFLSSLDIEDLNILAIEADPEIYRRLSQNIALNDLDSVIQTQNVAVSGHAGTLSLSINTHNRGENSIAVHSKGQKQIEIPTKPLLTLLDEARIQKPDAIKLDLEGAEYEVLKAFFQQAPERRYPTMMILEHAPDRWKGDMDALLAANGYEVYKKTNCNQILLHA